MAGAKRVPVLRSRRGRQRDDKPEILGLADGADRSPRRAGDRHVQAAIGIGLSCVEATRYNPALLLNSLEWRIDTRQVAGYKCLLPAVDRRRVAVCGQAMPNATKQAPRW